MYNKIFFISFYSMISEETSENFALNLGLGFELL